MRSLTDELEIEKNHSGFMAAMAQFWMRRAQDAEMMLAVAVHAAGGKIAVHRDQLEDGHRIELARSTDPCNMTLNLTAKRLAEGQAQ